MTLHKTAGALAALGLLTLSACASMSEEDQQAAASAQRLTNADLHTSLADHTLSGTTKKGDSWIEYFAADGTIKGLWKGSEPYSATWRVEGDRACFDYPDNQFDGCSLMAVSGEKVFWLKDDGTPRGKPAKIVAGNSQSL